MGKKFTALMAAVILLISGIGCATTNPDGTPNTATSTAGGAVGGALLGAGLGALLGLATGNVARGAAIGAIAGASAGALGGFVYAKTQQKMIRDRVKIGGQEGPVQAIDRVQASEPATAPIQRADASQPTIDIVRKAKKAQELDGLIFQDRNSGKWFLEDRDGNSFKFDGGQWVKIK